MFRKFDKNCCLLCGKKGKLSGEHKIKRTQISNQFGKSLTFIGNPLEGIPLRPAQSPKSKNFHFAEAKICIECNGTNSQLADREFDRFIKEIAQTIEKGESADKVFELARFQQGKEAYLNVFRYFAKLLCCHIAESAGPIPVEIANFAIGINNKNYIRLEVKESYAYEKLKQVYSQTSFPHSAHGGLIIVLDKNMKEIECFFSSVTIGNIQCIFHIRLKWLAKQILKYRYNLFYQWCIEKAKNSIISTEEEKLWHGLI